MTQTKAERVLDLYQGLWEEQPLGKGDYVISADEKTSIQARLRLHPTEPPRPEKVMRVEFEYEPGGEKSPPSPLPSLPRLAIAHK